MPQLIKISVVIPCYNGARHLRATLESALAQTLPPHEILVVDDGSTDDSARIAESFGPPVRVIRQENQGESVARNRGIDEARGDWIAFLDADDLWDPAKLEQQAASLDGDHECVAVCTGINLLDSESGQVFDHTCPRPEDFTIDEVFKGAPCHISSLLVRNGLPVRFPTWTRYGEDALYIIDLAQLGPIKIVASHLTTYRRHAHAQSKKHRDIEIRWHQTLERWIAEHAAAADAEEQHRLRARAIAALIRWHQIAHWNREWDRFDIIHQYLGSFRDMPGVDQALLLTRRYPLWCYRVRSYLQRLTRPRKPATPNA